MIRESYLLKTVRQYPSFNEQLYKEKGEIVTDHFFVEIYRENKNISGIAAATYIDGDLFIHLANYHWFQLAARSRTASQPLFCTEEDRLKTTLDSTVERAKQYLDICRAAIIKAIHWRSENAKAEFLSGTLFNTVYPIPMNEDKETLRKLIPIVARDKQDAAFLTAELEKYRPARRSLLQIIFGNN